VEEDVDEDVEEDAEGIDDPETENWRVSAVFPKA
jgi:hypothetical protein